MSNSERYQYQDQNEFNRYPDQLLNPKNLKLLSHEWNIPEEDILMIALNASGIKNSETEKNERGRFEITFPNDRKYLLALTVTDKPLSSFEHKNNSIIFDNKIIAEASPIENDTCTDSYWRKGKTHLTLNSNSRSNCRGCVFCGTYSLKDDDEPLTNPKNLRRKITTLQSELGKNMAEVESIGVVTGCFPDENQLVDHLMMIRKTFGEFGFTGELAYIGSQLRSLDAIQKIIDAGPFSLYLTVEAFDRRDKLIKKTKSSLDLESGKKLLGEAKRMGAETSFLYIAGLDSCETMMEQFPSYEPVVTRLPQIQTFQVYVPEQIKVRRPEAGKIEYFLKTRKIVENSFPNLLPITSNNYRGLWYTNYKDYPLPNLEI